MYNILLSIQLGAVVPVAIYLFFISAPYGRFSQANRGVAISPMGGWFLMELPSFLIPITLFLVYRVEETSLLFLLILFTGHYGYRSLIYPLFVKSHKAMPLKIVLSGALFNTINSYINFYYIFVIADKYSVQWFRQPTSLIGLALFLSGWLISFHSDRVLQKLRRESEGSYAVPNRGLHRLVASPNYLGEIVEWFGWFLLCRSLPALAFSLFTAANLLPRAHHNYLWYKSRFKESFPSKRKRIIPLLF